MSASPEDNAANEVKYTYSFGQQTDGDRSMKNLLGGKGANLAEMAKIGLPVPPGFTITTEVCTYYYDHNLTYPESIEAQVKESVAIIEGEEGKTFGDSEDPLLFSVRSGARESMPGMMDTILNLGLNDEAVEGLAKKANNPAFAYDCYRRFIQMYGDVVMGVQPQHENDHEPFEVVLSGLKEEVGVEMDNELTVDQLKELISRYKTLIQERAGEPFPQDPYAQLWGAVGAVFSSWNNERAKIYRAKYNIPAAWGTAVNVQTMVFGNMGDTSATGVAFTRDPANGEKVFYGEYLINAQGEDVVAGIRTPHPIAKLNEEMPQSYKELDEVRTTLEQHFKDMQDFEFTVQDNKLYMLQTRNGKRTGLSAVRIAYEMVQEGLIDEKTAVSRIPAESISSLLVPVFDEQARKGTEPLAVGLPAGPGAATGRISFTAGEAEYMTKHGDKAILCRVETTPEDLKGMIASEGILTSRGGVSSHAALVARQMGKVCVCGAHDVVIDYHKSTLTVDDQVLRAGDFISIDGTTGEIFAGHVDTAPSEVNQVLAGDKAADESYTYQIFSKIMEWADKYRTMNVRTNADTPEQSSTAVTLGAEGIGLCRTEHMFFEGERIDYMRQMILSYSTEERRNALDKLLPFQREDFTGIFREMKGRPVTIRLLDPPLHEFLPHEGGARHALAEKLGVSQEAIADRVAALHEANPMLGHRGCRLGITYPEITEMQARAIFEAAADAMAEGVDVNVEVMVPLVGFEAELENQSKIIHRVAEEVSQSKGATIKYMVGTMIEIPRAALNADAIAKHAEFFSFGTNDLTQTTMGMSRDDSGSYLPAYKDLEILTQNPFASIDVDGVGALVDIAVKKGQSQRPDIKLGICGEHGGDSASIHFFHNVGLNYVSCSPPRVPVARLAAAQAALKAQ